MAEEKSNEIVEVVVYRIKPDVKKHYVDQIVDTVRDLVRSFDGFVSIDVFQGCDDENLFMDYVRWTSLEEAEQAAREFKVIQQGHEFEEYRSAFEKLEIFSHFKLINSSR